MNPKTVVFVAYHKNSPLFSSSIFRPLHVGASVSREHLDIARDDTGEHISDKNRFYCELTGLYWAWRNYLPSHPEVDRIGFCHYRRFLDVFHAARLAEPFRPETFSRFFVAFEKWDNQELDRICHTADVFLPGKINLQRSWLYDRKRETVYSQLARGGHAVELDALLELIATKTSALGAILRKVFLGHEFHGCLTFIMDRALFNAFAEWLFSLLAELEADPRDAIRTHFLSDRTPGFLAERLLDVWLATHAGIVVRECDSVLLADEMPSAWSRIRPILKHLRHPPADARSFQLPPVLR